MNHIKKFFESGSVPTGGISTSKVWVVYRRRDLDINYNYKIYLTESEANVECQKANEDLKKMTGFVGPVENYFYSVFTLDDAIDYIKDGVKDEEFLNSRS